MEQHRLERFLTNEDKEQLANYDNITERIKEYAQDCVDGFQPGLLLFGAGGNGKSYSIMEVLRKNKFQDAEDFRPEPEPIYNEDGEQIGEDEDVPVGGTIAEQRKLYVHHQGRITPKGLVKEMGKFPNSLHLIEDAETLFDDKNAWGVFRMALHSQDKGMYPARKITWKIAKDQIIFNFTGSIILVGNRSIDALSKKCSAEIDAVKTRVPSLNVIISNAELLAKMKSICEKGCNNYKEYPMTRNDCYDVLDYLLECRLSNPVLQEKRLNFRLLEHGFKFFASSVKNKTGKAGWQRKLKALIEEQISTKQTRRQKISDERMIVAELTKENLKPHERYVKYCEITGTDHQASKLDRQSQEYKKWYNRIKQHFKVKKG